MEDDRDPYVRVVVLNWNSAWFTRRCLDALARTDYPADRFEVVLVDNGSVDGSLERLRDWFPDLQIVANGRNLGFAEGCNRAMRDRDGVDAVALINNDTAVDAGWLRPLVDALVEDPGVGAASALLVLEPGFVPIDVEAEGVVTVRSVSTDGFDVTGALRFDGFEAVSDAAWPLDVTRRLVRGRGRIWVPAGDGASTVAVRLDGAGRVSIRHDGQDVSGPAGSEQSVVLTPERIHLVNGLGTARNGRCEGYDRHYGVPEGELTEANEHVVAVDGVCGGAALLRSAMLDDVGLLDPRLFAYYEDTDLSWRATLSGWRLVAVPASRVEHAFGAAGGIRATGFFHLDRRNWWLTAERNGTEEQRQVVRAEVRREVRTAIRTNVAGRLMRRRAPSVALIGAWARIVADHRIEMRRRGHPSTGLPGIRRTDSVVGRFQPRPRPRVAPQRPWGPVRVVLDVSDLVPRDAGVRSTGAGWDPERRAAARRLVRSLLQDHREIDLVPVLDRGDGTHVVAGPREVASLLGAAPFVPTPRDAPIPGPEQPEVTLRVRSDGPVEPVVVPAPRRRVDVGPAAEPGVVARAVVVAGREPTGGCAAGSGRAGA